MRKSQVSGKHVSEQYFFLEHKSVYCVYTRNLGANLWLLVGAKSMPFGCMSMARLGAKYAEVGCKVYGYFWVHVCGFWVHVYGAVGCMYAVVGCKSMETFGCMSMPFGCMSMDRLGACLTVGSLPDSR